MRYDNFGLRVLAISMALVVAIGSFVSRSVVEMPAWQRVGPISWATFSRQADLGNREVLYPVFGIGSTVLAVALANRLRAQSPSMKRRCMNAATKALGVKRSGQFLFRLAPECVCFSTLPVFFNTRE